MRQDFRRLLVYSKAGEEYGIASFAFIYFES